MLLPHEACIPYGVVALHLLFGDSFQLVNNDLNLIQDRNFKNVGFPLAMEHFHFYVNHSFQFLPLHISLASFKNFNLYNLALNFLVLQSQQVQLFLNDFGLFFCPLRDFLLACLREIGCFRVNLNFSFLDFIFLALLAHHNIFLHININII